MTRRRSYQPLGRFWAARPAKAIGGALAATSLHPNAVTITAAAFMLAAAALIATCQSLWLGRLLPAAALAIALILDTADGHMARLQGTVSNFGRWLDDNLDELGDMALHAAIAWSAYGRFGHAGWLLVGMLYPASKYMFVFGTTAPPAPRPAAAVAASVVRTGLLLRLARLAGHADVRWHVWIVLAAVGRLQWALAGYAAYFAARALGGGVRKAAAHAA